MLILRFTPNLLQCVMLAAACAAFFAPGALAQGSGSVAPDELRGAALVEALRGGGYTLLFRHATRDISKEEKSATIDFADCSTQVPLAEVGRTQAQSIGEAFAKLGIPVGESIASPFCRTMDTARLIAGRVTAEEAVRGENAKGIVGASFQGLARIVATPPARGTNRVVVGHVSGFEGLGGTPYLQEGEAAVYKPTGDGGRRLVARLRAEDWKALASPQSATKPPTSGADPQLGLRGQPLINVLRAGGYTIYFRHALTDTSQQDRAVFNPSDCFAQRNLSEAGREQAARIGEAFKALRLPVTEILASPYCRTMKSAQLIAGPPKADPVLRGKARSSGGTTDYSELAAMLATPVTGPGLRVLVGHGNGLLNVGGEPHLEEGEAAVLRAVEGGGWIVIARLRAPDWDALAEIGRAR